MKTFWTYLAAITLAALCFILFGCGKPTPKPTQTVDAKHTDDLLPDESGNYVGLQCNDGTFVDDLRACAEYKPPVLHRRKKVVLHLHDYKYLTLTPEPPEPTYSDSLFLVRSIDSPDVFIGISQLNKEGSEYKLFIGSGFECFPVTVGPDGELLDAIVVDCKIKTEAPSDE